MRRLPRPLAVARHLPPVIAALLALATLAVIGAKGASASAALPTPWFVMSWGSLGPLPGQFTAPLAATVDRLGNVYVVDTGNARIEEFDRLGNLIRKWGSFGTGFGTFNQPGGIAIDPNGN